MKRFRLRRRALPAPRWWGTAVQQRKYPPKLAWVLALVPALVRVGEDDGVRRVLHAGEGRFLLNGEPVPDVRAWYAYASPPGQRGERKDLRELSVTMDLALRRLDFKKGEWFNREQVRHLVTTATLEALARRGRVQRVGERYRVT